MDGRFSVAKPFWNLKRMACSVWLGFERCPARGALEADELVRLQPARLELRHVPGKLTGRWQLRDDDLFARARRLVTIHHDLVSDLR
ncbi:hypothetical protein [Allomesorhizobium camelthorni]|uniref:Uncharacterized protein n=1 Tax=Allomesorhizobium camelthorni TaxID=475069 RepID=A0A6G4WP28_9HYPH|nr:hypothetical protein [Mesorhizobium camelthorni]NGO55956.1 hypothetical protein [Mesorhizobium camelthorni]